MPPQALRELVGASKLRVLNLVDCSVGDEAVEGFMNKMPAVAVSYTREADSAWAFMEVESVRPPPPSQLPGQRQRVAHCRSLVRTRISLANFILPMRHQIPLSVQLALAAILVGGGAVRGGLCQPGRMRRWTRMSFWS